MLASDPLGWAAVIADSAPGASIRRVSRLGGGIAAETFAIETSAGSLVVKRYPGRRETVELEWERLQFAQRVGIPVPVPLALDASGRWFGAPAFVMTRLAGQPDVRPRYVDPWLQQLAHALVAIHMTDTAGAGGPLLRPSAVVTWRPPKQRRPSTLAERTVAAIQGQLPRAAWRSVLIHGDFHPGNTLWHRHRLTGVADWSGARLGPGSYELAYCRADVALLLGLGAADRLAHHYGVIAGTPPGDLPVFDLICGLEALRSSARMLRAYRQQGRTDSPRQFADRATAFLRNTLAEIGA